MLLSESRVYLLMAVKYIRVQFLFGPALTKVVTKATPQELKFELQLDSLLYVYVCDSMFLFDPLLHSIYPTVCFSLFIDLVTATEHHLLFNSPINIIFPHVSLSTTFQFCQSCKKLMFSLFRLLQSES